MGRLSSLSEARYGLVRGLGRIVALLERFSVAATFYVPGVTVEQDAGLFVELSAAGHEIAHHGHRHLPSDRLDAAGQREEIARGLEVLRERLQITPAGYRSPAWELTPITLELLAEYGFAYDSSLMDDDRPYTLALAGRELVELPVHWSLDDVPHFAAYTPPEVVARLWMTEADLARREGRHITYTMHPEITGRPQRIGLLEALLEHLAAHHTPTRTHQHVAARMAGQV